nr:reverse transcriptase domain-containing protein [Tanacetum cinerariifolium]
IEPSLMLNCWFEVFLHDNFVGAKPLISESFQATARLFDFKTVIRAVFSSTLKFFAIMTGNLSSPFRNLYSRWGGKSLSSTSGGSSSRARKASTSSRRKSLFLNGVRVGEVNKLSLPYLSPTCMTLELVDRSISRPIGVAEDVFVKVGTFHFPADFVVVDFDVDPRVPLILKRSFLKTGRALIDVFEGELVLRVGKEAITFNLNQTSRYSANYNDMAANQIDVIDMDCEEYSQEVLGNIITNPQEDLKGITTRVGTAYQGPMIPTTSSSISPVVERETEATKDTVHLTNNGSTKDVQPPVVPTESPILNSELIVSPIIEPAASPVSAPKPNSRH